MNVFTLPPRSPDLNPLDYSIWAEVNKRMRAAEEKFRKNKKETRDQYINRLAKTARALPRSFITKSIMSMKKRFGLVYAAKGGLIQEGS